MNSIKELQKKAYEISASKGWHNEENPKDVKVVSTSLALIHSEVSEALECVRDGLLFDSYEEDLHGNKKPVGFPSEMADVVIRVMDLCESVGVDLEKAILDKMEFNKTRKHRHGGRLV